MCKEPQQEISFGQKLEVGLFPKKPDDSVKVKSTNGIICPALPYYLWEFICWSGTLHLLQEGGIRDLPLGTVVWGRAQVAHSCLGSRQNTGCVLHALLPLHGGRFPK